MLNHFGRAAPRVLHGSALVFHRIAEVALGLVMLLCIGSGALAWRLSQGPLDLEWLGRRLQTAINSDIAPSRVTIGGAALVWEGFQRGVDQPLDIRLKSISATAANGQLVALIPRAEISLSPGWLLLGRLMPRAIQLDGVRLRVLRAADGTLSLDLNGAKPAPGAPPAANPFDRLLGELASPPQTDLSRRARRDRLSQLRRLRIQDARVVVVDQQLGATWRAPHAEIDLRRAPQGGVSGIADIDLALGGAAATLHIIATLPQANAAATLHAALSPVSPASLAAAAGPEASPTLRALAALNAPVGVTFTAALGPYLQTQRFSLTATLGAGTAKIGQSVLQLGSGQLTLAGTTKRLRLQDGTLQVLAGAGGTPHVSTLKLAGFAARGADGRLDAQLALDIDQLHFADLAQLFPAGLDKGARGWMVQNITDGSARNGHVDVMLAGPDLDNLALTGLRGGVVGENLTIHWLRPLPPISHANAVLSLTDPDSLTIIASDAVQTAPPGIAPDSVMNIPQGRIQITGLQQKDQIAQIDLQLAGPVAAAIALLQQKRLHLLSDHHVPLHNPAGDATAQLSVRLPLRNDLIIDQVGIAADVQLRALHLARLVLGHDLQDGQFALHITNDGMTIGGQGKVAGLAAQADAAVDFTPGGPSQKVLTLEVTSRPTGAQLAAAGLAPGALLSGQTAFDLHYVLRNNQLADLAVSANLRDAALVVAMLGWVKPAGQPASAELALRLDHDRLVAIDSIAAEGHGLSLHAAAEMVDGSPSLLRINRAEIGRTSASGDIRFPDPENSGAPIRAELHGSRLDLSGLLSEPPATSPPPAPETPPPAPSAGPAWILDARFDTLLLAHGLSRADLRAHAENNGQVVTNARIEAGGDAPVLAVIAPATPGTAGRRLTVSTDDAGRLLRELAVLDTMEGGTLHLAAVFNDARPTHPLEGSARIDAFRIRHAPVAARLLQAMTLYGLVGLMEGPGLGFTTLMVPFTLDGATLDLHEARGYSPSVGMTAKGQVDLRAQTLDLQGTIVPAYFFNRLLGDLPLVGKLFSPETGGGVFAATYSVRGPFADPTIGVNPLAALTPGFLRGVFKLFRTHTPATGAAP